MPMTMKTLPSRTISRDQGTTETPSRLRKGRPWEGGPQKQPRLLKLLASGQGYKRSLCGPQEAQPSSPGGPLRCGGKPFLVMKCSVAGPCTSVIGASQCVTARFLPVTTNIRCGENRDEETHSSSCKTPSSSGRQRDRLKIPEARSPLAPRNEGEGPPDLRSRKAPRCSPGNPGPGGAHTRHRSPSPGDKH